MKLNHIGIVVSNIEKKLKFYEKICDSPISLPSIITDKIQGVKVCFINIGKIALELIEPLDETSPVSNFLKKGGGFNHLCFETDNMEEALRWTKDIGGIVVKKPLPAAAFGGKRIAFASFKGSILMEFLEVERQNG